MSDAVRTMWMRGGTSKGGYFIASAAILRTARKLMDGFAFTGDE